MKTINEAVQTAANITDKDNAMDRVTALLVKAFPEPKDIVEWIADAIPSIYESNMKTKNSKEALYIIWTMVNSMLPEFLEAKTRDARLGAAWNFTDLIMGSYQPRMDDYTNAIESLDKDYMTKNASENDPDEIRKRIYQFDALKEIGKLTQE